MIPEETEPSVAVAIAAARATSAKPPSTSTSKKKNGKLYSSNGNNVDANVNAKTPKAKAKAVIPTPKAAINEKKQTKPPKLSKKDKKQPRKDEKVSDQSSQTQSLLVIPPQKNGANQNQKRRGQLVIHSRYNGSGLINNNIKSKSNKNKNKKVSKKIVIMGLKKNKKKKETEEERDQALAAISTSRSWDVDEDDNYLQVITEEELDQTRVESGGGVLSPLQMAQAALAALALSPQRLVNGLQACHTNCVTTNNNNNNINNSESDSEDDADDDMTEGNSVLEEHEADSRSPRRGDEPGVLADAVEGFLALIGLGDPADDATTIEDSKKEIENENKKKILTRDRRSNLNANVKGKDEEVTTTEDGDGCMGGITTHFLNGISCRKLPESSGAATSSKSSSSNQKRNNNKSKKMSKVGLLLKELQESPSPPKSKNKTIGADELNNGISLSFADSMIMSEGVEGHDRMYANPSNKMKSKYSCREIAESESSDATSSKSRKGVSKVGLLLKEFQESPSPPKSNNKTSGADELNNGISLSFEDSMIMTSEGVEGHERMYASPSNKMESKYYLNTPTIDNPTGESPCKVTHIVDVDLSKFDLANVNLDSMSSIETPMLTDLSSVQMTKGGGRGGFENGSIGTAGSDLLDPNLGNIFVDDDADDDDDDDDDEIRQSASDESSVEQNKGARGRRQT
jgi:hypothetical protein